MNFGMKRQQDLNMDIQTDMAARCISAEVYGYDADISNWNQWVGDLRTLDTTPTDGVTFNYTLIDSSSGLWLQYVSIYTLLIGTMYSRSNRTARNARTNELLATFNKTSDPMTMINTAVECQSCTPPVDPQYWTDITIRLSDKDENFADTLYQSNHASNTPVETSDGGKTWTIANVTIPVVTPIAD